MVIILQQFHDEQLLLVMFGADMGLSGTAVVILIIGKYQDGGQL